MDTCSICLDPISNDCIIMKCKHVLHEECMKGMTSLTCPLCRFPIEENDIPNDLYDMLINNSNSFRDELEKEDRNALIQHLRETDNQNRTRLEDARYSFETYLALKYLKDMGIPERFIPVDINIKKKMRSPNLPQGALFSLIISFVIRRLKFDSETSSDDID